MPVNVTYAGNSRETRAASLVRARSERGNKFCRMARAVRRHKLPPPALTHTCANRKSRQPACSRANFREPTYIPLSRVTEHGIQFVAVSSIGREEEGLSPRRVTSPSNVVARAPSGLKVTEVIQSRCTKVSEKRQRETSAQFVKFVQVSNRA